MIEQATFTSVVEFRPVLDKTHEWESYYLSKQNQERWQALRNSKEWRRMAGIYGIHNVQNGRVYVGRSRNLWNRWMLHLSELRRGVHHSPRLQQDWNELGCDVFRIAVFEVCEESEVLWQERFWSSKFAESFLYNARPLERISNNPHLGAGLRELRERSGLSSLRVAWLMETTESTVRNWEKGRSTPRLDVFKTAELCKLYQCSIEELAAAAKVTELKTGGDR